MCVYWSWTRVGKACLKARLVLSLFIHQRHRDEEGGFTEALPGSLPSCDRARSPRSLRWCGPCCLCSSCSHTPAPGQQQGVRHTHSPWAPQQHSLSDRVCAKIKIWLIKTKQIKSIKSHIAHLTHRGNTMCFTGH